MIFRFSIAVALSASCQRSSGIARSARRAAYEKLQQCADDLKVADAAVVESISNIKAANQELVAHEAFMTAHFPKITFHDLWKSEVRNNK